jgi:hypothetical protein
VVDVSTIFTTSPVERADSANSDALREFILTAGRRPHLSREEHLAERLALLDELDALAGDLSDSATGLDAEVLSVARTFRAQLESLNEKLYKWARAEIALQGSSRTLRRWLLNPGGSGEAGAPDPGPGFDLRDEIVSGVLQLREPVEAEVPRSSEMVPYQPTPVRHILSLVAAGNLSDDDILIDLGSGLGHVPLLLSILCGIRTLGIERQPAYVASARECAQRLNLQRAQFVAEDARLADLSSGTVFYLFSSFTGLILTDVLDRLRMESIEKRIRICSLGPCTRVLADQNWLSPGGVPDAGRIAVFTSR